MTIRGLFIAALVGFALTVTALAGVVAWQQSSRALTNVLDVQATTTAGAAVETGLQSSLVVGLLPGFEDSGSWLAIHARLRRLRRYVREAYIVDQDTRALVSSLPADSVPIGAPLPFLEQFEREMDIARGEVGNATTPAFEGSDGFLYKWGFAQLEQSGILLAVLMPADFYSPLVSLRRNLLIGSVIAALLAAGLGALLAARITDPVERLSRVAVRIQRGHMEEPVALEPGVELGRLSRAMERMRRGIQERDEQLRLMLAQVAHEIRNPLGGLELFASAAADTEDPAERAALMRRVRSEVSALNTIIEDFLTFARPGAVYDEATDLRPPLGEAADLVRAELRERGGTMTVDLPSEPLLARVGPDHAKRMALNLLRNAAQVSDHVELQGLLQNGEVLIRVQDDGPGVAEALRDRIFDPFVTDKEQGAGLGLAIVRKLAETHAGRVELAPAEERTGRAGAEFRIYFPGLEDLPYHGSRNS